MKRPTLFAVLLGLAVVVLAAPLILWLRSI